MKLGQRGTFSSGLYEVSFLKPFSLGNLISLVPFPKVNKDRPVGLTWVCTLTLSGSGLTFNPTQNGSL